MENRDRLFVTVIIWLAFAIVTGTFLNAALSPVSSLSGVYVLGIVVALTAAVAVPTAAMWHNTGGSQAASSQSEEARLTRKAKRDQAARLQSLIERLDEDEIVELETLLQSREEEADWRR